MDVSNLTPSQLIAVCFCALIGFSVICYLSFRVAAWTVNFVWPVEDPRTVEERRIEEYFHRVYRADMSKEECDALNAERWIN